ncbi:uncharacterized protein LOC131061159 isoform X2 [Cryptomeria japonica]|uniref:uncharacterized protein LOC131061159 isoform X2 n=1 Tax=Cryptomeria japonica TaxID=3369 RepID=UPI0027D9EAF1|nr:uncharacterized protein LOC131061159 isoform X2 [Cryptomeria japonica]
MCALVKLPMICRPFMGVLRKNGVEWNWRRGLHGLPQDGSVICLRNSVNGAEVYLVGTCHVSEKSAQLVKQIALEECKRLEAQLLLIDEDIYVTVRNLGDVLSRRPYLSIIKDKEMLKELAEKLEIEELLENTTVRNFFRKLTEKLIENTTQRNFVRKLTEKLTSEIPDIVRVILTQRDQMMFENLRKCKGKVVAVVGMAHMDGIEQMWKDIEQNL